MSELMIVWGVFAAVVSWGTSIIVRSIALRIGYVDIPAIASERKLHRTAIPYGGGIAITIAVVLSAVILQYSGILSGAERIRSSTLLAIVFACAALLVAGFLDDRYKLPPRLQLIGSLSAVGIVLWGGLIIRSVSLPGGTTVILGLIAPLVTFLWILLVMYTTKLFDGVDGLTSGVGVIGGLILFGISLLPELNQPHAAFLGIILAGACFGFLLLNWYPATLYLGEGGSLLIGFLLAALSIISGTKVVTTLLVIGLPLYDLFWVVARRVLKERRSPFQADRKHLHHRLLDAGLTSPQVASLMLGAIATVGALGYLLQTPQKIVALVILLMILLTSSIILNALERRGKT